MRYRPPERRAAESVLERASYRDRIRNDLGAMSRGSKADSDISQVPVTSSRSLRDPADGLFWFVVGYSKVGGPDKVPEV
jgi:hypothetical protein